MAEEVIYDQVESGDPDDPLGLRKKLKQVQPKSDPLGLRSKLVESRADKVQQPAFQVQISEPTFKSTPMQTGMREFSYEKPVDELAAEKLKGKAAKAQSDLLVELKGNRDIKEKMIRQRRFDEYSGTVPISKSDMPKTSSTTDVERIIIGDVKPQDLPVTEDDFIKEDIAIGSDRGKAVRLLEETMKQMPDKSKSIQKNVYLIDAFNSLSLTPEKANERAKKIEENAKRIGKDLIYDPRTNTLVRPLGIIGSAVEGWKQKSKLFSDYDFLKNTENDAAIAMDLEDRRTNIDPDEPVAIPKGKMSEISSMIGGTPIKPLIGGVVSSALTTPLGGAAAGSVIGGREFAKMEYAASFQQVYNELRDQGVEKFEAVRTARKQAEQAAEIGAISGAAMGAIGGRMGARPLAMSDAFKQSAFNVLKAAGDDLGKAGLEGLAAGGVGAAGQVYKNKLAQNAGINRELSEGVWQQIEGNLLTTVAMAAAIKSGRGITKANYRNLLHGLSRLPDEQLGNMLTEKVSGGEITQKAADETLQRINEYKEKDAQIPVNVTEDARFKIQDNIDKINELEAQKESTHKSLQGPIKERITKLEEDNIALSQEVDKPVKSESGLTKKQEKEATEFAEELIIEGVLPDTFESAVKSDPIGFWKEIAQQAQNRGANWKPLGDQEAALSEQAVRDQFGDTVVDYAKELFPAPEVSIPESVSVIRPNEISRPETVTISPREQPKDVRSTESVSVIMPKSGESESITIKPKEDAIQERSTAPVVVDETPRGSQEVVGGVSEPGEAAVPQEGQQPTQEESIPPSQEGQVGEPKMVGITHAQMDEVSKQLGLPEYTKDPETFEGWTREAKDRMAKDPEAINNLIGKLRRGDMPDPVETQMMKMHFASLKARYNDNPTPALLAEINRTKDLYNMSGRQEAKSLVARKGLMPEEDSLADYHMTDVEFNKGAPLTDEQMAQSTKEFNDINKVKEEYEQRVAKLEAENTKLKAAKVVKEAAAKSKPQPKKDYVAERKDIIDSIKKKWDASKGQLSSTFIPYADRLVAIAPDVVKLMRSYVEQGITELPDVIKAIHKTVKDAVDGIEEKDIHDIIAGVYTEKKPTRNQLAQQLYDLRKEARLINELEQLENGIAPVSQKKQIIRNQKIEALKQQIIDLRDELGLNVKTDAEKLSALKARYKKQITDLEKKIADEDYGPDEKPEPIKLDKEAQDLRNEYLKLKEERALRLLTQQYADRPGYEKIAGGVSKALKTGRTLKSSFDVSYPMRQTIPGLARQLFSIPFTKKNGKWTFDNFSNQRQLGDQFKKMYQAFGSERNYRLIMDEIYSNPKFEVAEKSKLAISDMRSAADAAKEEMYYGSYAEKIPIAKYGVKASHRAATVIANKMKWDIFDVLTDQFAQNGKTYENSPELYEATAKYANQLVGRGFLGGKVELAAPVIAHFVYSLRLYASRLQLLTYLANPNFYRKVPKEIRVEYLKDMAKFVALGGAIMGLSSAAGLSVGLNPLNSDFGTIEVGNSKYDIWGGFKQYVVLFSRFLSGKANAKEELRPLFSEDEFAYNEKTYGSTLLRFLRTKASPELGTIVDITTGRGFDNKKVTFKSAAIDYVTPLIWKDIQGVYNDQGVAGAMLTFILAAHGVGVQTYEKKEGGSSGGAGASKMYKTKATKPKKQTKTSK